MTRRPASVSVSSTRTRSPAFSRMALTETTIVPASASKSAPAQREKFGAARRSAGERLGVLGLLLGFDCLHVAHRVGAEDIVEDCQLLRSAQPRPGSASQCGGRRPTPSSTRCGFATRFPEHTQAESRSPLMNCYRSQLITCSAGTGRAFRAAHTGDQSTCHRGSHPWRSPPSCPPQVG